MNLLKKSLNLFQNEKWSFLMGWRFISYFEGENWVSFEIEPMYQSPCIIKVPADDSWEKLAPTWAKEKSTEILDNLKSIPWNRELIWQESPKATFLKLPKGKAFQGNLECSVEGRRLEEQRLFHPKAAKHYPIEKAKQNWYRLVQAYVASRQGDYYIPLSASSPNSVTREVEWPAARANININLKSF